MSISITGSNGFVGENLVAYLTSRGVSDVRRINLRSEWENSIADGTIVHLAGKAHDVKKTSTPDEYYKINFELTKKLYDVFLQSEAKKFVYISSVKAVADSVEGALTEDAVANPQTHYGKSKLMAEHYIQTQPLPQGKSYYILRPCMIHGPNNKGNLNLLYKFVQKGIPYPLAAFENKRSFLTIENLCFVINEIMGKTDMPSGIYNISDDEPLSTNEVIFILSASLNKKPLLWRVPPNAIKMIAKTGDLLHLPLTTERLEKLTENYVVDNSKIKKALGKDLPRTSAMGMQLTAQSFKVSQK